MPQSKTDLDWKKGLSLEFQGSHHSIITLILYFQLGNYFQQRFFQLLPYIEIKNVCVCAKRYVKFHFTIMTFLSNSGIDIWWYLCLYWFDMFVLICFDCFDILVCLTSISNRFPRKLQSVPNTCSNISFQYHDLLN